MLLVVLSFPSPSAFVYCYIRLWMRLIVVSLFPCWRPRFCPRIIVIFSNPPPLFWLIVALIQSLSTPAYPLPHLDWLLCGLCGLGWPLRPLSLCPEVNRQPVPSSIVRALVGSLSGVCHGYGGWIATSDTEGSSGGVRDGVDEVWCWLGGHVAAAGMVVFVLGRW